MRLPALPLWILIPAIWSPILVSNTTTASRFGWAAFSFVSSILLTVTPAEYQGNVSYRKLLGSLAFLCFGSLVILRFFENTSSLDHVFRSINSALELVLPFMRKLGQMQNVSSDQVMKARTLNSFWFLSVVAMLLHAGKRGSKPWILKPATEPNIKLMLSVVICPLFAVCSIFGYGEFHPNETHGKLCLLEAYCYIGNDLSIIASVMMRTVSIFGFGVTPAILIYSMVRQS